MLKHFFSCFHKKVTPTQVDHSLIQQLDTFILEYNTIIYKILEQRITFLEPSILDTIHMNKAYSKGLINELYIQYNEHIAYSYTRRFDRLETMLYSAIRRQFMHNHLRIPAALMKRKDITDILTVKLRTSFSADF